MAITGGFGFTADLESGVSRKWVVGRDGIKRWADNGDQVAEIQTALADCGHQCAEEIEVSE